MNERILSPSAPKGFAGFIARQYDLILLTALALMIVSGVIGRNLLILRLSLVVAFNNLIHGFFPPLRRNVPTSGWCGSSTGLGSSPSLPPSPA